MRMHTQIQAGETHPARHLNKTPLGVMFRFGLLAGLVALVLAGCGFEKITDRINMVVVGDSLSAGTQNSCLLASQQENGYANVIARQAGIDLVLPLVTGPGSPACLDIAVTGIPLTVAKYAGAGVDATDPANWGVRMDPTIQPTNLAVPGARVVDIMNPGYDVAFFDYYLQYPYDYTRQLVLEYPAKDPAMSMVDQAEMLLNANNEDIDFAIFWLGSNDALWAAVAGNPMLLTPQGPFGDAYRAAMARMAATGAKLVVGNVPSTTVIPHLFPAEKALAMFGLPWFPWSTVLGVNPGDFVTMGGLGGIYAILNAWADPPLANHHVTTASEVNDINTAITGFNKIIAEEAHKYGAIYVDVKALLDDVHANGYVVGEQKLTTDYCGGIFSLDGIHPTNSGYAVLANTFIDAINTGWHMKIPKADVAAVLATEPLKHFCVGRDQRRAG